MRISKLSGGAAFLVPVLLMAQVQAQTTPDAGTLLRDQQAGPLQPLTLPREREALPAPLPDSGERVVLKQVVFEGFDGLMTEAELQALVAPALNQPQGFNGLQHLANLVTQRLRERGYLLAFAWLPEQDISQGILRILIEPGQIDQLRFESATGELPLSQRRLQRTLDVQNTRQTALQAGRLERGLLLLNDLSGVVARSTLEQGREPGTTSIRLHLASSPRYTASTWADNHGNRYTGAERLGALGNINNLSGLGDRLSLLASLTRDLQYAQLGYTAPLGYSGLTGEANLSLLNYALGEELKSSELDGRALNVSISARYPLLRSRLSNLNLDAGYHYKSLQDDAQGSTLRERTLHNLTLGVSGDHYDAWQGGGLSNASLSLTLGNLSRDHAADAANDAATFDTDGRFSKLNFSALRLQRLSQDLSLYAHLRGQLAFNNLDSSEQFNLGGVNGVRAYPNGESSGDSGWLFSLEGRYTLSQIQPLGASLQLTAFYDLGGIKLSQDGYTGYTPANANANNSHTLMGAGLGASLSKAGQWNLSTSLASKLNDDADDRSLNGKDADGKNNDLRLWLQASAWF